MKRIIGRSDFGYNIGDIPRGCKICFSGASIVIFITGLCRDTCYYCPISFKRRNRDVVYVDDEKVGCLEDIIREAHYVRARGAAITGGDPLIVLDRTIKVIEALKNEFTDKFHIHLYTSGRYASREALKALDRAGLDEIRFHPIRDVYLKRLEVAFKETSMNVGIEVPAIPGAVNWLKKLALYLEKLGGGFMNINELEASESNINNLLSRGYRISRDGISVEGSYETALEFLQWARDNLERVAVRFCPAMYKDKFQLRNRFMRKAMIMGKPYEKVTRSGTLRVAVIRKDKTIAPELNIYRVEVGDEVITHPMVAEKLGEEYQVIEYYPTTTKKLILQGTRYPTT